MSSALGSFEKVLRVGEGRRLKRIAEQAEYVLSLQPEFEKLSDAELQGKTAEFRQRLENGESLEELLFEAYAAIREAFRRDRAGRALQGAGDGRHRPPRGRHRRDEDRRGQDVRRDPAALPQLARRARACTSSRSTTTSPSATPSGRAPCTSGSAPRVALHREHDAVRRSARRRTTRDITYGTNSEFGFDYLRDNMAVSLEGVVQRSHSVRDRRRGRLDPDRRGAHAADHLRRARDRGEGLLRLRARRRRRSTAIPSTPTCRRAMRSPDADYVFDEKFKTVSPPPSGDRGDRARAGDRQPLRPAQRAARQPPQPGAEGAVALPARRRLRRRRTARSRSSTSSPAGSWKAAAGARACTRPSRRRRACGSRRRTSRSRRSPCRTTSASTRSSPA